MVLKDKIINICNERIFLINVSKYTMQEVFSSFSILNNWWLAIKENEMKIW